MNQIFEQELLSAVQDDDGTFTLLRLGKSTPTHAIDNLRVSLRALFRLAEQGVPLSKEVIFACSKILYFKEECLNNSASTEAFERVENMVNDLAQCAFEVLAGSYANEWLARRPDLEYCSHDANGKAIWIPRAIRER
jgi:hypothetical protein